MSAATRLVLVGMMGAGKSTVGAMVADRLGVGFIDLDRQIERDAGLSVAEIFESEGEQGFRVREVAALRQALASQEAGVVAAGGGVVTRDEARSMLASVDEVVLLEVSASVAAQRVAQHETRPLLDGDALATLERLSVEREDLYREVATHAIRVDELSPAEVTDAVLAIVGSTR